jgi:uncharacterized protein YndB with AHSA1/START domain
VFVTPAQAWLTFSQPTAAPPQLAWEFVTAAGRRPSWQVGVTGVSLVDAPGGRRTVGATNHCAHGAAGGVLEEILDWRPYDYLTDRGTHTTPSGPVRMLETIEFEPTATGTTVHFRYAAPVTAKERAYRRGRPLMPMLRSSRGEVDARRIVAVGQLQARAVRPGSAAWREPPRGALGAIRPRW